MVSRGYEGNGANGTNGAKLKLGASGTLHMFQCSPDVPVYDPRDSSTVDMRLELKLKQVIPYLFLTYDLTVNQQ